jgi:hypothetical protein
MTTRRRFLLSLAGGFSALVVWRGLGSTQADAIAAVLHKRLDYLQLDDAGVAAFARDLIARGYVSPFRLRFVSAIRPLYERLPMAGHSRIEDVVRHGEERIVTLYLLSSDFFIHGADMARTIRYVGFYDPVARPCSNPFARFGT